MTRNARTAWTVVLTLLAVASLLWAGMHIKIVKSESATSVGGGVRSEAPEKEYTSQEEWQIIRGTVVNQEENELSIRTDDGTEMEMGLGPWGYWLAHGITLSPGDEVEIKGFESNGEFEPAEVRNLTSGEHIVLRNEDGSPVWRGSEH